MAELLACPFCRQLYPSGETRRCPDCGVTLVRMDRLPPSHDVEAERLEQIAPGDVRFAWNDFSRGRGALLLVATAGLVAFLLPWVIMTRPEALTLSGFDLARRSGWLWGGAIGWFLTIPLVWTRRTPHRLRGVRAICAVFAAMTALEVLVLLVFPPRSRAYTVEFSMQFGLYLSAALSLLGVWTALRLGHGPEPATRAPPPADPQSPRAPDDRVLH